MNPTKAEVWLRIIEAYISGSNAHSWKTAIEWADKITPLYIAHFLTPPNPEEHPIS